MAAMGTTTCGQGATGLLLALAAAAPAVAERAPLLPPQAFQLPRACAIDPFAALGASQVEHRLASGCAGAWARPQLTPRLGFERSGGRAEAWIGQRMAWQGIGLSARLQFDMAARLTPDALSARTRFAAGVWWQPDRRMALGLRLGGRRDDDGERSHQVSLTSAWRPFADNLLFTRWREDGTDAVREVGWRWWLVARRVSLDLLLPADPERDREPARLSFAWRGLRL